MTQNIKSELFFLKQYGYSDRILEYIFLYGNNPLHFLFEYEDYSNAERELFTKKDLELSKRKAEYLSFKTSFFYSEPFLRKNNNNKIYFKYDDTALSSLLPPKIQPLFMYSKGIEGLLSIDKKRVSIVGTRKPSEDSIKITQTLVKKYVENDYIVVSGLAEGVDTSAHIATIDHGGKTIAVLPTNLNNIYPKKNTALAKMIEKEGLLLTSVGPNQNTFKSNFLERNQYVAYLSDIILVIETNLKSGTMNTIRNASMANKKIYFVDQKNDEINKKIIGFGGVLINEQINNCF